MVLTPLSLPGLSLISPEVHGDARGFFVEAFNARFLREKGIDFTIVQHNRSRSKAGVIRGIHFQYAPLLGKIIRVSRGKAFVVAVDIRYDSPTLGKWEGRELSEENQEGLHLPSGFGSAFAALEDSTEVEYYYDAPYSKEGESNIIWNDTDLAIAWPTASPILSERDQAAGTLKQWLSRPESRLFRFSSTNGK